jgi:hypothetical protein
MHCTCFSQYQHRPRLSESRSLFRRSVHECWRFGGTCRLHLQGVEDPGTARRSIWDFDRTTNLANCHTKGVLSVRRRSEYFLKQDTRRVCARKTNTDRTACSWLLRSVRWFETDVSKLPIGPIFKDQYVQEDGRRTSWPVKMGPIGSTETSVSNHLTPRNNTE